MQRLTALLPVLLLAAFAALTYWLDHHMQQSDTQRNAKTLRQPDYIVENFSATNIGSDGIAKHTLSARRMLHYPHDDTTLLESPRFVSMIKSAAAVTVTSKNATLSSDGENAYLSNDVVLVRAPATGRSELRVTTSYLHVILDKNIATTDKPVQISNASTRITSVGLEFNGETGVLKLLSNVRGTYEKSRSSR